MRYPILLLILLVGAALGQPADWPDPFAMEFATVEFTPSEPERAVLGNGIVVYLAESRALPIVTGVAYVDARSTFDPVDKVSLASFTANLLREGGAGGRTSEEIDAKLEFLAASVETGANDFFSQVSFTALSDNVAEVLPIWRDVLIAPDFDEGRIEIERQRQLEAVRRVVDNPVQVAVREFFSRIAEGHPSGAYATEETTSSITRSDLIAFHGRFYQPSATVIAVSGDFDSEEMVATLEELFGAWPGEPVDYPDLPAYNPDPGPKIYYGFKEIGQSVILLGHPSVTTYSEAYNDFNVANEILGGDFSSRLVSEIRVRRGLAYSAGSFITESFEYPSNFVAYSISPAQATGEVIELLLSEIRRIQEQGVSEEELERSRQTILNQSLFRFTSSSAVNERTARVQLLGLEPGYYERYLENLQTITAEEVREAAVRELRPDEVVILVVGDDSLFDRPLSDFGEVVTIELE